MMLTRGSGTFCKRSPVNNIKFGTKLRNLISSIFQITLFTSRRFLPHHQHSLAKCFVLRHESNRRRFSKFMFIESRELFSSSFTRIAEHLKLNIQSLIKTFSINSKRYS